MECWDPLFEGTSSNSWCTLDGLHTMVWCCHLKFLSRGTMCLEDFRTAPPNLKCNQRMKMWLPTPKDFLCDRNNIHSEPTQIGTCFHWPQHLPLYIWPYRMTIMEPVILHGIVIDKLYIYICISTLQTIRKVTQLYIQENRSLHLPCVKVTYVHLLSEMSRFLNYKEHEYTLSDKDSQWNMEFFQFVLCK